MFRVFYDDGTTYDGPVVAAPGQGVIVVVQSDPDVGRELLHMKDFYVWDRGRWLGVDTYGCWDYLARPGWKKVLAGRTTTPRIYSAIFERAASTPDFPVKSARLLGEAHRR